MTTKRIIRINASALKKSACMLHYHYMAIDGYRKPINDVAIEFGSAIHVFTRTMFETEGNIGLAMHAAKDYFEKTPQELNPKKKYLTSTHLFKILPALWTWYQDQGDFDVLMTLDNKPAVEITFSNKYYEDDNFIVYLEGTLDMLGKFKGQYGSYAIGDWKSTSSWDWVEYLNSYRLSTQLMYYLFNLKLHAKETPDSMLAEIASKPVGMFVNAIFLNGEAKTGFERSEIFYPSEFDLAEFERMLKEFITDLIYYLTMSIIPPRQGLLNGACYGTFGKCQFYNVCAQPDDIARAHILRNNYIQTEYLPLKNSEEKV